MPRMLPLRTSTPDIGNVLARAQNLKTGRLQEEALRRQAKQGPELHKLKMKRGHQLLRQGEQRIRTGNVEYTLEKLDVLARLLRGVHNEQSYAHAIDDYIRMFPDEAGGLKTVKPPKEYSQDWVDAMVQVAESASERAAAMGLAGQHVAAGSRVAAAQLGLEGRKQTAGAQRDVAKMKLEGIKLREGRLSRGDLRDVDTLLDEPRRGPGMMPISQKQKSGLGKEGLRDIPGKHYRLETQKPKKSEVLVRNTKTGEEFFFNEETGEMRRKER